MSKSELHAYTSFSFPGGGKPYSCNTTFLLVWLCPHREGSGLARYKQLVDTEKLQDEKKIVKSGSHSYCQGTQVFDSTVFPFYFQFHLGILASPEQSSKVDDVVYVVYFAESLPGVFFFSLPPFIILLLFKS